MSRHKRKTLKFWCIYNNVACSYYFGWKNLFVYFVIRRKFILFQFAVYISSLIMNWVLKIKKKVNLINLMTIFVVTRLLFYFVNEVIVLYFKYLFRAKRNLQIFSYFFPLHLVRKFFFLLLNLKYSCYRVVVCCSWFTKIISAQIFLPHYSQWFQFYFCNFLMVVFERFF